MASSTRSQQILVNAQLITSRYRSRQQNVRRSGSMLKGRSGLHLRDPTRGSTARTVSMDRMADRPLVNSSNNSTINSKLGQHHNSQGHLILIKEQMDTHRPTAHRFQLSHGCRIRHWTLTLFELALF